MRGSQRLLQRLLQCGAVGEALRAAAGGGELAAARSLARTVAARGFAAAGQQAWRAGALRPAAGSFAASQVRERVGFGVLLLLTRGLLAFAAANPAPTSLACTPSSLQLQKSGLRQFGFAAGGALRGARPQAAGAGRTAAAAALRRPQGMAGSSLLRSLGRRMKATVAEFRGMPNAAEVRNTLGWLAGAC